MKSNVSGISALVLVLVAFSSLVSMIALTRIDNIVNRELEFSYGWAMPYWTMTTIVFAMGWFNIIIAIAFQFYVLLFGRRVAEVIPQEGVLKPETTYQSSIEEKPIAAEKEKVEETIVPPMEVELDTQKEGDEVQKPAEEPKEEPVTVVETPQEARGPVEEITTQEYIETEQYEEVKAQKEQEAETPEWVETEREPEEKFEEPQEAVDVQLQEETSYAEEEEREQEEMPRETVETETHETPPPAPEREAETTESEEPQTQTWMSTEEHETSAEETQQQEAELTEHYPT